MDLSKQLNKDLDEHGMAVYMALSTLKLATDVAAALPHNERGVFLGYLSVLIVPPTFPEEEKEFGKEAVQDLRKNIELGRDLALRTHADIMKEGNRGGS